METGKSLADAPSGKRYRKPTSQTTGPVAQVQNAGKGHGGGRGGGRVSGHSGGHGGVQTCQVERVPRFGMFCKPVSLDLQSQ